MTLKVKTLTPVETTAHQEKEKLILQTARKRFGHYGYSKVTMDEVAEDIGVVKGAIYYYFPTKEKLFEAVVRQELRQFTEEIQKMLHEKHSYRDLIYSYVKKRQQFFRGLANLSQLDYPSWTRIKSTVRDLFETFESEELTFLQQIFQEGHRSGEFAALDSRGLANLMLHSLQGLYLRTMRNASHGELNDEIYSQLEAEMKFFARIFVSGITNTTKEKRNKP